jgi:hypothetical protein
VATWSGEPTWSITAIADGKKGRPIHRPVSGGEGELNKGEPIDIPMACYEGELAEHERFPDEVFLS